MQSSGNQKTIVSLGMAEAAQLLGIPRTTLAYRVATGKITAIAKLPGKTGAYIFDRDYIEALADKEKPHGVTPQR